MISNETKVGAFPSDETRTHRHSIQFGQHYTGIVFRQRSRSAVVFAHSKPKVRTLERLR
jgi:hypothetical protein